MNGHDRERAAFALAAWVAAIAIVGCAAAMLFAVAHALGAA